jgi:hypothetical protein
MTMPIAVVFVPVPIGSGNNGWCRRRLPPSYPAQQRRDGWPLRQSIPIRDERALRDMLAEAKRLIAETRARRLLPGS